MWVSIPVSDEEMKWLQTATGTWRQSTDHLYRRSQVELALVTESVWQRWKLPSPSAPILTVGAVEPRDLSNLLSQGAEVVRPIQKTAWGAEVGFIRLPSGVLLEITGGMGGANDERK